jgi:hypothetical protein
MSEFDGMAPDLSPEEQKRATESIERMRRRLREGRFRPLPDDLSRMESMAPWMRVVKEADGPAVPIPDLASESDTTSEEHKPGADDE